MNKELLKMAAEIRTVIAEYQEKNKLTFIEETHTYYIEKDNKIISNMPSVSTLIEIFSTPFIAENTRAFKDCNGDPVKEKELLDKWAKAGSDATNPGSRMHYYAEKHIHELYKTNKVVRKPIYTVNDAQRYESEQKIKGTKGFIDLMHERGAVMLDTEIIMGSLELGYFGQPDNIWLLLGKSGKPILYISDWKSNVEKNFKKQYYTKPMKPPFAHLWDTALSHYFLQLPFYSKLLQQMLKGSKFEDIKFAPGVVVRLDNAGLFHEYKVPEDVFKTIMNMDIYKIINK